MCDVLTVMLNVADVNSFVWNHTNKAIKYTLNTTQGTYTIKYYTLKVKKSLSLCSTSPIPGEETSTSKFVSSWSNKGSASKCVYNVLWNSEISPILGLQSVPLMIFTRHRSSLSLCQVIFFTVSSVEARIEWMMCSILVFRFSGLSDGCESTSIIEVEHNRLHNECLKGGCDDLVTTCTPSPVCEVLATLLCALYPIFFNTEPNWKPLTLISNRKPINNTL